MDRTLDINCDLGEGLNNESALMPYISSCSIACGGHAGSKRTIRKVIDLTITHKVKIGAHPSFPDRANFGRIRMDMPFRELEECIEDQLALIRAICNEKGVSLNHIKPHGALYNLAATDQSYAELIVSIVKKQTPDCKLYVPYNSVVLREAKSQGVDVVIEAFADRNYNSDYSLVSRNNADALITDPVMLLEHLLNLFYRGQVRCLDGAMLPLKADTFCVHGDNPNTVEMLRFVSAELAAKQIKIAKKI